jgi:hypothetical protein
VLALALLLGLAVPRAHARNVPSAGDQYVEQVPTAKGARPVAGATGNGTRSAPDVRPADVLSPRAAARLRRAGRSTLPQLTAIATSAGLGAPQERAARHQRVGSEDAHAVSSPSLPSAALSGASGGGQLPWLTIVLAVLTAAAVAVAVYERRSRRGQP